MRASRRLASSELALAPLVFTTVVCGAFTPKIVLCICVDFRIVHVAYFVVVLCSRFMLCADLSMTITQQSEGTAGWSRVCPWRRNFIPASYTCTPLHQLSLRFAPHTVLPGDACSKRTHTHTTHSLLAQIFFIGVKVSDSIRGLQTDDYVWLQPNRKVAFFFNDQFLANTG